MPLRLLKPVFAVIAFVLLLPNSNLLGQMRFAQLEFPASKLATFEENSAEGIAQTIVQALKTQDFDLLKQRMPTQAEVTKLMALNDQESDEPAAAKMQPAQATTMLEAQLRSEFDNLLSSARNEHVKLKKLSFARLVGQESNPEAGIPMKVVTMEMLYKTRPVQLAFTMVELDGQWRYIGTLLSQGLFGQLRAR